MGSGLGANKIEKVFAMARRKDDRMRIKLNNFFAYSALLINGLLAAMLS